MTKAKIGRNDPCHCGSGKKQKHCCKELASASASSSTLVQILQSALQHHQAGHLDEAEIIYRKVLSQQPDQADALHLLGMIAFQREQYEAAVQLIKGAIQSHPSDAGFHNNLGNAFQRQQKLEEAANCYRDAIAIKPDYAAAYNNLGVVLQTMGKHEEAGAVYEKALELQTDCAEASYNLGNVFSEQKNFVEAIAYYEKAIQLRPDYGLAYFNLAQALRAQGKSLEAIACYEKTLHFEPKMANAANNAGVIFQELGRLDDAVRAYDMAISIAPDYAAAHHNLGHTLQQQGKMSEALACYRKASSLDPKLFESHNNTGVVLHALGRFRDAVAAYEEAILAKPDYAEAYYNLGNAFKALDEIPEAVARYEKALSIRPDFLVAYSNLLYLHASTRDISPEAECSLAAKWECSALSEEERTAARNRKFVREPRHGRKLRLGIVSAEIGEHAVAEFLEPFMSQMDRNRFHITLFPTKIRPAMRTARILSLADEFRPLVGLSDSKAAELVRSREIDLLMDTTGHTCDCRLGIFAHRAAPVQFAYIGYWSTTGLTEMDWVVVDKTLPAAYEGTHFREGLWRLPCLVQSYKGDHLLPTSSWQPSPDGTIWMGSFNRYSKIREETLSLWGKVMRAIPESKLLLEDRAIDESDTHQRIVTTLGRHGIASERIEFEPFVPGHLRHMVLYDRLDIALDTIPFNSGTTGCDALWMGVPLVALEGNWSGGRIASTFLKALGKTEWIAQDEDEYVAIVAGLARDIEGRKILRSTQRDLIANSPMCDAKTLAGALEDAFEQMYDIYEARSLGLASSQCFPMTSSELDSVDRNAVL